MTGTIVVRAAARGATAEHRHGGGRGTGHRRLPGAAPLGASAALRTPRESRGAAHRPPATRNRLTPARRSARQGRGARGGLGMDRMRRLMRSRRAWRWLTWLAAAVRSWRPTDGHDRRLRVQPRDGHDPGRRHRHLDEQRQHRAHGDRPVTARSTPATSPPASPRRSRSSRQARTPTSARSTHDDRHGRRRGGRRDRRTDRRRWRRPITPAPTDTWRPADDDRAFGGRCGPRGARRGDARGTFVADRRFAPPRAAPPRLRATAAASGRARTLGSGGRPRLPSTRKWRNQSSTTSRFSIRRNGVPGARQLVGLLGHAQQPDGPLAASAGP